MCDVFPFVFEPIVPLDENDQFYLHLFGDSYFNSDTLTARVEVRDKENWLEFFHQDCSDFDSKTEVDLYGICDPTTPLVLQKYKWNKVHVTVRRSPLNVGEFGAIERNDHCPYAEDVHCVRCIIIEIAEKTSVLRLWYASATVNCISGKSPHCGSIKGLPSHYILNDDPRFSPIDI